MSNIPNSKFCFICGKLKPLTEFHKHSSRNDGYRSECKECRVNKQKKDYNSPKQRCTICFEEKLNTEEFFFKKKQKKGSRKVFRAECKECHKKRMRNHHLKNRYGMLNSDYEIKVKNQENKCAICLSEVKRLMVDHDHVTGKVRDLLCDSCNRGLGFFKEDIKILINATEYIKKHNH